METSLRKEAAEYGNAIFNIDDEYALHICSTLHKPFEVYKPKQWSDATFYIYAESEDGIHWNFVDSCGHDAGSMETSSIDKVATHLWGLNRNRHFVLRPSQGCCGQSSFAKDFRPIPADSIIDIFNLKRDMESPKPVLSDLVQSASSRTAENRSAVNVPTKVSSPDR